MAYRADIEIAVKGAQELKRLQDQVNATSKLVDGLNNYLSNIGGGGVVRSINNLNAAVADTAAAFNKAALGTEEATLAARNFVSANNNLTQGLTERLALLKSITEQERRQRLGAAGIRETSGTTQLGPGPASPVGSLVGQKSPVAEKINRTLQGKKDEIELQTALLRLEEKSAAALNEKLELQQRLNRAALAQGKTDVETVSAQQAQRQQFLAGKSGTAMQGPLAPAGAMGFPVALSLSRVEQRGIEEANKAEARGLEIAAKKQEILQRTATTRQALAGLAGNLQRLDQNSVVAIADAARGQAKLVELAKQKAELAAAALKTSQAETKAAVALAKQQQTALAAKRKERSGMVQNAMIGGAFPMLFGGGAGAVIGGAAGGFIPGNPMMSIVTSALGTMVDEFAAAAIAVGAALMDTATTFDFVKEKSLFSSKELEKYATKLQEAGFVASASAVAQNEIINKVGSSGVEGFTALATESDSLNRAFADLTLQMQAFIAGPLAALLNRLGGAVALPAASNRATTLQAELGRQGQGAAAERLGREVQKIEQSPNVQFGLDPQQAADDIKKLTDYYSQFVIKPKVQLTQQQIDKEVVTVLEKRLQTINIAKGLKDQVTAAAREQESVDRQRVELVRSYEQSLASLREKVEERVSAIRLQTLQKENQLLDVQSSIRLKSLEIANQQMVAEAGAGQRPELVAAAKEVAQIVADYTQKQLSTEEEQAKIKRDAALAALQTDLEAAKFKINTEKEVSRLNTETARRVAEINRGVREKNQAANADKFNLEKQIADVQLRTIQHEFFLLKQIGTLNNSPSIEQQSVAGFKSAKQLRDEISKMQPPQPTKEIAGVGGGGVSFAGVDKASADFLTATKNYVAAQLALNDLDPVKNTQEFTQRITAFADKTNEMFTALTRVDSDEQAKQLRYTELISKGLTDTVAQKVIELETTKAVALSVYDIGIAQLQNKLIAVEKNATESAHNELLIQQIKLLQQRKAELEGTAGDFNQGGTTATGAIGEAVTSQQGKQLQEFINRGKADLNDLEAVAIRVSQGIGDAVGNSIASGISGLIEGTTSAKEVFATFLRDIGQMLVEQGTKMIATYIAIGIAKIFAGMGGGMQNAASPEAYAVGTGASIEVAAKGASFANGIAKFAKGSAFSNSVVSSPTLFKFADGGTTRTGLMGEAGPEAIMPLKRGSDGSLGVQATGLREAMGRPPGGANGSTVLNMSFQSTTINGVEYVSRDQLEAAMAQTRRQAAKDGANRGMNMTLDKIQNSPSTRSRVGIR